MGTVRSSEVGRGLADCQFLCINWGANWEVRGHWSLGTWSRTCKQHPVPMCHDRVVDQIFIGTG
jgi:hypothetical protein